MNSCPMRRNPCASASCRDIQRVSRLKTQGHHPTTTPLQSTAWPPIRSRKMCFVVQNHLGKGTAARPRCIPQAVALSGRRTHFRASRSYRRSITRGRLRSPCTHRLGGRSCPQDPRPFHGDQPCAVWMPPSCQRWITPKGLSPPLKPSSSGSENCLSTDTEPCTINRSIDPS